VKNKKEIKDKKSKDKRFLSTNEALKGIREDLIQQHKAPNTTYWRCVCGNYYTTKCNAKTAKGGESLETQTVSSQRKTQRSDEENEVETEILQRQKLNEQWQR
jgi:hypothetical protein